MAESRGVDPPRVSPSVAVFKTACRAVGVLPNLVDGLGIEPSGPMTAALQAALAPYESTHP